MSSKEPTTKDQVNKILRILTGNGAVGLIERLEVLECEHRDRLGCQVQQIDLEVLRNGQKQIESKLDSHVAWHAGSHRQNMRLALTAAVAIAGLVWAVVSTWGTG